MNDTEFLAAFESGTLPGVLWTHEAHVRMAYLYARDHADSRSLLAQVRERIRFHNESHGNRTGYHETITVAFLALIVERLRAGQGAGSWEEFRLAHADLVRQGMEPLYRHYTRDVLFSEAARASFVPPDAAPLPVDIV
ncbi:MAG: hypothetical protein SFU56_11580 [Capsulimonadales bacterium]|nr:hypothetical protein [Capsulimonadales bacterium]